MTKKEKEKHSRDEEIRDQNRLSRRGPKKKKTIQEEEREIHEAYQILLSEHNKRVRIRAKQKLAAVTSLMKINKIA